MRVETGPIPHDSTPPLSARAALLTAADAGELPLVERVLQALADHEAGEEDAIATYQRMAADDDPAIAVLMRLVLEDEERHHQLIDRIATSLRDNLNWTHSPNALPAVAPLPGLPPSISATTARSLADDERRGARQLRSLARELAQSYDGLLSLLLEMMALDSEKHERVLRYVERRLAAR